MVDETVIGCVRVDDGGIVTVGSVRRMCTDCGESVWIAPTGLKLIGTHAAIPVCIDCLTRRMAQEPAELQPITEGQIREVLTTMAALRRR